jgi:hypothetical protein
MDHVNGTAIPFAAGDIEKLKKSNENSKTARSKQQYKTINSPSIPSRKTTMNSQ